MIHFKFESSIFVGKEKVLKKGWQTYSKSYNKLGKILLRKIREEKYILFRGFSSFTLDMIVLVCEIYFQNIPERSFLLFLFKTRMMINACGYEHFYYAQDSKLVLSFKFRFKPNNSTNSWNFNEKALISCATSCLEKIEK